jgi:hypothetical protein
LRRASWSPSSSACHSSDSRSSCACILCHRHHSIRANIELVVWAIALLLCRVAGGPSVRPIRFIACRSRVHRKQRKGLSLLLGRPRFPYLPSDHRIQLPVSKGRTPFTGCAIIKPNVQTQCQGLRRGLPVLVTCRLTVKRSVRLGSGPAIHHEAGTVLGSLRFQKYFPVRGGLTLFSLMSRSTCHSNRPAKPRTVE